MYIVGPWFQHPLQYYLLITSCDYNIPSRDSSTAAFFNRVDDPPPWPISFKEALSDTECYTWKKYSTIFNIMGVSGKNRNQEKLKIIFKKSIEIFYNNVVSVKIDIVFWITMVRLYIFNLTEYTIGIHIT